MKELLLSFYLLLSLAGATAAQNNSDQCHVYVVDVVRGREAFENFHETGNTEADARALSVGTTIVGQIPTKIGEEELTTRTYHFPHSNLWITASVYYTDEMMASSDTSDSMLLGIIVSKRPHQSAFNLQGNAEAEITYDNNADHVRVKKYIHVKGRTYLVGLECDCKRKSNPE